jgi:hypothetical protein
MNSSDRTLRFGWWALLAYLTLGLGLEILHGLKVSWYLDVGYETRRLMFTLAHAHGTLLALVNIAAALTARAGSDRPLPAFAARALAGATLLLPGGFFLGGLVTYGGDPGLGIALVPIGALLLIAGVARIARDVTLHSRRR